MAKRKINEEKIESSKIDLIKEDVSIYQDAQETNLNIDLEVIFTFFIYRGI